MHPWALGRSKTGRKYKIDRDDADSRVDICTPALLTLALSILFRIVKNIYEMNFVNFRLKTWIQLFSVGFKMRLSSLLPRLSWLSCLSWITSTAWAREEVTFTLGQIPLCQNINVW